MKNRLKMLRGPANLQRMFSRHPLTCHAPLLAWGRFAKWQLRSRFQEEVLVDWIGDLKLAVRRGMSGATANIYVGLHEFFDMMVMLHFLRQEDLFLDVGANVGTYTVLASGYCRAKTCAFEPDPDTERKLNRNIEVNRLQDYVQVYGCALGAAKGSAAFTVGLDTMNRFTTANDLPTRIVPVETLDDTVPNCHPAMMKIDVEGAGLQVLMGAKRILANLSLKVVELEYPDAECERILSHHGFEIGSYDPFHRSLSRDSEGRLSCNTLFVRDWPFVTDRLQKARAVEVFGRKF